MITRTDEQRINDLMKWVDRYEIADEIESVLADHGYDAAVEFVFSYFGDYAESESVVAQFTL